MTRWREYVINAFNSNMPFDQFTTEQLAGDLLPNATIEQKIASGFNRNHMINFEGGAIPEEYHTAYILDRINTTGTVWLGLTVACTQCHDHKYDPITQKDYYQLLRVLQQRPRERPRRSERQRRADDSFTTAEQQKEIDRLGASIKAREAALDDDIVGPVQREWEKTVAGKTRLPESDGVDRAELTAHYELDGSFSDISGRYQRGRTVSGDPTFDVGQLGRAATFDGDAEVSFGNVGAFNSYGIRSAWRCG